MKIFSILCAIALFTQLSAAETNLSGAAGYGKAPTVVDVKHLGKEFMKNFPAEFTLNEAQMGKAGRFDVPTLQNGDWVLNDPPVSLVDSFSKRTRAKAAIFVKVGTEFVRISTSANSTGLDAVGAAMDHAGLPYKNLMEGKRYSGKVTILGKEFVADYDVLKDKTGKIIGAYLVALPSSSK